MSASNLPTYHNQPLKLTSDQIENPFNVVKEFFISYHLPDIRDSLKNWFEDSLHQEDSKEHYHAFTQVEKLIEACWVINEGIRENSGQGSGFSIKPDPEEILGKPPLLIELVKCDPLFVLTDIFKQHTLTRLRDLIRDWQFVSISTEVTTYDDAGHRKQLMLLVNKMYYFIEALFVISSKHINIKEVFNSEIWVQQNKLEKLSKDELSNPMQILISFFEKFPIVYLRRELHDW